MRSNGRDGSATRVALVLGTLAVAGCVPGAYVHEVPGTYYGGSGTYYPPPTHYYGSPGYYGYAPYAPRVVYVDHDHRGDDCRHQSHRGGNDHNDHNDRNDRDDRIDQRHHRDPPAGPQAGAGPPAATPEDRGSRRERVRQMADGEGPVKRSEERKDLD